MTPLQFDVKASCFEGKYNRQLLSHIKFCGAHVSLVEHVCFCGYLFRAGLNGSQKEHIGQATFVSSFTSSTVIDGYDVRSPRQPPAAGRAGRRGGGGCSSSASKC